MPEVKNMNAVMCEPVITVRKLCIRIEIFVVSFSVFFIIALWTCFPFIIVDR